MRPIASVVVIALAAMVLAPAGGSVWADHIPPEQEEDAQQWEVVEAYVNNFSLDNSVVMIGNAAGIQYVNRQDGTTENSVLTIWSASKWLTAATVMGLVEDGVMSLDDNPQDYITWWTDDPADPRSQITLEQLLSMTAGFWGEPLCIFDGNGDPEECAQRIHDLWHINPAGETFYYSSTHMHIAGVMAAKATGSDFNTLFRQQIGDVVGMDSEALYVSDTNPFLAGGGVMTAYDYSLFLRALVAGDLLASSHDTMSIDRTAAPVEILYSPVQSFTEWHYGLGLWRECPGTTWTASCDEPRIISSGGGGSTGVGFFPWIDLEHGYWGIVAQEEGGLGPSIELAEGIRPLVIEALEAGQPGGAGSGESGQMLFNGGFETADLAWAASIGQAPSGYFNNPARVLGGDQAFLFSGPGQSGTTTESITQSIAVVNGAIGDGYRLDAHWGGLNLGEDGFIGMRIILKNGDESVDVQTCLYNGSRGSFEWTDVQSCILEAATGAHDTVEVILGWLDVDTGFIGLDDTSLTRQ
ncbi:MAG: beta-lactamase family protein [Chloroflexi bacterium]|nr:beta-lactamase family protein [Chloroflexota bacterium]